MWCLKLTVALCFLWKSMKVYLTALTLSLPENLCCWCSLFKVSLVETSPNIHFVKLWFSWACTRSQKSIMLSYDVLPADTKHVIKDIIWCHKGSERVKCNFVFCRFSPGCAPLIRPASYVICTLCCAYCLPLFLAKFTSLNCTTGLCRWPQT